MVELESLLVSQALPGESSLVRVLSTWSLEVVLSWRSLLGDVRFFEEKSALTECSPRASCYLEQKVGGSWILCCLKTPVLKKSSEWCALFGRKSALTECSPRASCYLEQKVGGSWIWVVQRTENLFWGYVGSCRHSQGCIQVTRELQ